MTNDIFNNCWYKIIKIESRLILVVIWNDVQKNSVIELSFATDVRAVRLRRDRLDCKDKNRNL